MNIKFDVWISSRLSAIFEQKGDHLVHRFSSMGEYVFLFGGHLSEGAVSSIRNKNRVVSKASATIDFQGDAARADSFKKIFFPVDDQRDHCSETRAPVFLPIHRFKQFADVCRSIGIMPGIPGGSYARRSCKCVHFQSTVFAETVSACQPVDKSCFLGGVFFQCIMWFRNILFDSGLRQGYDMKSVAQYGSDFLYFVFVVGGKNEGCHGSNIEEHGLEAGPELFFGQRVVFEG